MSCEKCNCESCTPKTPDPKNKAEYIADMIVGKIVYEAKEHLGGWPQNIFNSKDEDFFWYVLYTELMKSAKEIRDDNNYGARILEGINDGR